MLKKAAMIFGIVFLVIGILGFIPGTTTTDADGTHLLFGLFMVDTTHNIVHIVSGLIGLAAASSAQYAKWYLIVFGLVYALITIIGLFTENVLGFLHVNTADNWLHLILAVGLLGAGFGLSDEAPAQKAAM